MNITRIVRMHLKSYFPVIIWTKLNSIKTAMYTNFVP